MTHTSGSRGDSTTLQDLLPLIEALLLERPTAFAQGFSSKRLDAAKRYALSSPGKRLRPLLVFASALACRGDHDVHWALRHARAGAVAVEYVHTYSLIHDDLPCMDDDDYRRGRLSTHRRFDEGLAVLTGDALLADAFFMVAKAPNNAAALCAELALTAGSSGLVGGQAEDLAAHADTSSEAWLAINQAKTARLFEACAVIGGLSVDASKGHLRSLRQFGKLFGIAFQLKDDLDDDAGLALHDVRYVRTTLKAHVDEALHLANALGSPGTLHELIHLTFATAV